MPLPAYPGMTNYQPLSPNDYAQFDAQNNYGGQSQKDFLSFLTNQAIRRDASRLSEQGREFDLNNELSKKQQKAAEDAARAKETGDMSNWKNWARYSAPIAHWNGSMGGGYAIDNVMNYMSPDQHTGKNFSIY